MDWYRPEHDVKLLSRSFLVDSLMSRKFNGYDGFTPRLHWTGVRGEVRVAHRGADCRRPRITGYGRESGVRPDHSQVFLGAYH